LFFQFSITYLDEDLFKTVNSNVVPLDIELIAVLIKLSKNPFEVVIHLMRNSIDILVILLDFLDLLFSW